MWQRVTVDDPDNLQKAFKVFQAQNWVSDVAQLAHIARSQSVYYYAGPDYELAGSFAFRPKEKQWYLEMGSVRGAFSRDAVERAVQQIVDFSRGHNATSLYAVTAKKASNHFTESMIRAIRDAARKHPSIRELTQRDQGGETRWQFHLK